MTRIGVLFLAAALWSAKGDLLVVDGRSVLRHDERSGALLSSAPSGPHTETTDAGVYGPDGNIYAAGNSLGAGTVLRFDGRSGAFVDFFAPMDEGFYSPLSMGFGPDGDLYIGSLLPWGPAPHWTLKGTILRRDGKTGARKEPLVPVGVSGLGFPRDIEFGSDGTVYVLEDFSVVRRFKLGTGEDLGTFAVWEGWSPTNYAAASMTFGPDGNLYWLATDVRRFDGKTGAFLDTFINLTEAGLLRPAEITFGPDGDLYVGEGETLSVKRFDGKTGAAKGVLVQGAYKENQRMTGLAFSTPRLRVAKDVNGTTVRWPQTWGRFSLESRSSLEAGGTWEGVLGTPISLGNELSLGIAQGTEQVFFRLRRVE